MNDLQTLLDVATDEIETPDLARTALATARRRRTRRRGAVAAVTAGVAVAGVVVVPQALDGTRHVTPGKPGQTPDPTPTSSPSSVSDIAPNIPTAAVQQSWDPATAPDLPYYPIASLPQVVAPAGNSHSEPGDRVGPLAVSRSHNDRLAILFGNSGWHGLKRLYEAGDLQAVALSRDGTRLAVLGEQDLYYCDATELCPSWTRIDLPNLGGDGRVVWGRDPDHVIVSGYDTAYAIDLGGVDYTELPRLDDYASYDVAPDGRIVARDYDPPSLSEFDAAEEIGAPVALGDLGSLNDLTVSRDAIAATRIDVVQGDPSTVTDADGLVVVDRDGLGTRAFLPLTGSPGAWVDEGQVKPVQWLSRTTVLVSVLVGDTVHLVAWNTMTGGLGHVASYPASFEVSLRDLSPA